MTLTFRSCSRAWTICLLLAMASGGGPGCGGRKRPSGGGPTAGLHRDCFRGEVRACVALGGAYHRGRGVKRSLGLAARYYEEACALGSGDACFRLGRMYEAGRGIPRDAVAAVECYGMACVFSEGRGCYETGQVFSRCRNTPQAAELAARFYRMACSKQDLRGCDALHQSSRLRQSGARSGVRAGGLGQSTVSRSARRGRGLAGRLRPDPLRPGSLD